MWIETDTYIGPCRRGGDRKLRLFDRRRWDGGSRDPSLGQLVRQLRAAAQDLTEEDSRRRFRLRLAATIDMAKRQNLEAVADPLARLLSLTDSALSDSRNATAVEQYLLGAYEALPQR
jgi:hypothetical protein